MIPYVMLFAVLHPGDGPEGTWTDWSTCPEWSYASKFTVRIERYQGRWKDDSGLNSIGLACQNSKLIHKNGTIIG